MKIFVAGATGAIGKRLIPLLTWNGHEVVAMTRSLEKAGHLRALGAEPVVADGLHRNAVIKAVMRSEPEVVVHEMTSLIRVTSLRSFDHEFALTNRLRTEGTDNLLEGARRAGARRFVAQSYGNWYDPAGPAAQSESESLNPRPPRAQRQSFAAIRHLERAVLEAEDLEGVALRYAGFYGPGTGLSADGVFARMVRKRAFPIIGNGAGVWSFVHIDDAAQATVNAIERGAPGVYNVADDEPAPVSEWLPELARALDAKPPRHIPVWLGRLAGGEVGVLMMTGIRGASNAKAKRELGWRLQYPTWREGFRRGLSDLPLEATAREAA